MAQEKSILEEAIIQMKNLEEAVAEKCKRNTWDSNDSRNQRIGKRISN